MTVFGVGDLALMVDGLERIEGLVELLLPAFVRLLCGRSAVLGGRSPVERFGRGGEERTLFAARALLEELRVVAADALGGLLGVLEECLFGKREEDVAQRIAGPGILADAERERLGMDRVPVDRCRVELRVVVPAYENPEAGCLQRAGVAAQLLIFR